MVGTLNNKLLTQCPKTRVHTVEMASLKCYVTAIRDQLSNYLQNRFVLDILRTRKMAFQENSNGSSNYLQKNRRFITPYLALILRRKLLIILICILCVSFALFGWYRNKETQNELLQSARVVQSHQQYSDEYQNFIRTLEQTDSPETDIPLFQKQHVVFMEDYELPPEREKTQTQQPYLNEDYISSLESSVLYSYERETDQSSTTSHSKHSFPTSIETSDESLKYINPMNKTRQLLDFITPKTLDDFKPSKSPRLVLDTHGCKIPKLDPWDPSVINLIQIMDPFVCCGPPLLMYPNLDGSISLNESVLLFHYDMRPFHISCSYQAVYREHEFPNYPFETGYSAGNVTKLEFGVPLNEEFVGAYCNMMGKFYYQYLAFPLLKPEIEDERNDKTPPEHRLNVILVGIDSVSKLNFLRHFTRTRAFLKEKMHPFSMKGYTKVGDNTFPNLVPMLTGRFVEHYYNESMAQSYFFDDLDLIWKDYAKRGYRTFYAEDSPYIGTFNYVKRGFYDPPTDYYLRTILLAMEHSPNKEYTFPICVNSQLEAEFIYDYLKNFIKAMDTRPYNAFAMVSKITHDIPNYASYADEPTVHLLEDLWNSGTLNNSVLFLFSDHGVRYGEIRYTYVGKFEEKMPFMYIHFPKWFLDQHPEIAKNLETNQERLMTLFDVHATMLHLLDLDQDMTSPEKRSVTLGSSLLQEISPNRTCEEANIKQHYCPCQSYEQIPVNDSITVKAAQAIVDDINTQLLPLNTSCAHLELDTTLDARVNDGELEMDAFKNYYVPHKDYLITLITKPGQAVFDGTVRYDPFTQNFNVLGISRINMYRDQSICIDSQKMKIFCFCNK